MPKYRYQATDAQGNPVSGELAAAGPEDARRKLAAQGFDPGQARLAEIPEPVSGGGRLSDEEAVDLGVQLAELIEAGLPLAAGLRAVAEEIRLFLKPEALRFLWFGMLAFGPGLVVLLPLYPGRFFLLGLLVLALMPLVLLPFYLASLSRHRRTARVLRRLADRLDAGVSLEDALESEGRRFPTHVRGLIRAGIHTGRLPEALHEFVDVEKSRIELRRQVWLAIAYPSVLLAMLFAVFTLICVFVIPQFAKIFEDFGMALPPLTQLVIWMSGPGLWLVVGVPAFLAAAFVFLLSMQRMVWARRVLYAVPLLGPTWRWAGLSNFSRLMALLLGQQVPLPTALRLTAAGLREADLAAACRGAADEVEGGRPLSECLAYFWQFPPTLRPLVEWAERTSNPAAAFHAGTEMFEGRVRVCVPLLEAVLPPIVFLLVLVTVVFLVLLALFMPLISLISALSG